MVDTDDTTNAVPASVVDAFAIERDSLQPVASGHINRTFKARRRDGTECALQRVNEIFAAEVNHDIAAVCAHLQSKGLAAPDVLKTENGALWHQAGGIWRALGWIEGLSLESARGEDDTREAGRLLGRFHRALTDLEHDFVASRFDPHDVRRHQAALEQTLQTQRGHAAFAEVVPVASDILEALADTPDLPTAPRRVVHGDPKISNVLFHPTTGAGICLVDLDTVARRSVVVELGDALRSWCNPAGEDATDATFSLELFVTAIEGYAHGGGEFLDANELAGLPAATCAISVELAARFAADALNESFFHWNRSRFTNASAHNLARAKAQLAVARAAARSTDQMHEAIARAFGI